MPPTTKHSELGKRPRASKRSPLGWFLAQLWKGVPPRSVLAQALGAELGDRVWQAATMAVLERAVRERQVGDAPRVEWRRELHVDEAEHLRRMAAFALIVLERTGSESGKAAHRKLWLGNTWRVNDAGQRVYVPSREQLGIAGRLGVSVRQLERYIAVLEVAGVWRAWQPQEHGARAPEALPRHLRGETYAYQHYQLIGGCPRQLRDNLERFYGKRRPEGGPANDNAASSSSTPPRRASQADDELAAAIADLSPELARFLPKPRPPD